MGNAQTTRELFPEAHEWTVQQKEAMKDGLIQRVTITLYRETMTTGEDGETGGTRWLELVARTLRDHARGGRKSEG